MTYIQMLDTKTFQWSFVFTPLYDSAPSAMAVDYVTKGNYNREVF